MVTIGCGCGSALDWVEPSRRLIEEGLDYMMLEVVGSVSTCRAAKRAHDGGVGYHPYLKERFRALYEGAAEHGTTVVTNAGIVDPIGAGRLAAEVASEEGISAQVVAITGDDCLEYVTDSPEAFDLKVDPEDVISANAYIGTEEVLNAFELLDDDGVGVVIGGRIADPSLAVAPLAYEFGWDLNDWTRLGRATLVGHLLECSAHITGGFFADPPRKTIPDLYRIGYPYAEVEPDGTAVITKPDGSGGRVDRHTAREQLFYELHDPSAYVTPDVVADFSSVELTEVGPDRIEITGGTGHRRPDQMKALVGTIEGYEFEKFIPLGGPNAAGRAAVIEELVERRLEDIFDVNRSRLDLRMELLGVDGLYGDAYDEDRQGYRDREERHEEIILRVAASAPEERLLDPVLRTVATTLPGPGGSGVPIPHDAGGITEKAHIEAVYVDREAIERNVEATEIAN
jgi:hypothetical protein